MRKEAKLPEWIETLDKMIKEVEKQINKDKEEAIKRMVRKA